MRQRRVGRVPRQTPRDSVGAGASMLFASRLATACAGWIGSVVVVRNLSTGDWGGYSFVFGLLGIVGMFVDLQVGRIVLREVIEQGDDAGHIVGSYFLLRVAISVVAYGAIVLFVVAGGYEPEIVRGTLVAGLTFLSAGAANALTVWFDARLWLRPTAVAGIIGAVLQLTVVLLVATTQRGSIVMFALAVVIADAAILAWRVFALWRYRLRVRFAMDVGVWWTWIKESIPLAIGFGLVTLYYKVDIVMLGELDGLDAVGQYGIGYKFADVASFLPLALMTPVLTLMVAAWPHRQPAVRRHFHQAMLLLFIGAVAFSVGFALVARPLIDTLYGERYADSVGAARLLVAGAALQFFSYLCIITLISIGRHLPYTIAGVLGLATNVVLNFALIPAFSFNGSAAATVLTEIAVFMFLIAVLCRMPGIVSIPWGAMARTAVAGAALAMTYLVAAWLVPWPVAGVAAGFVFFAFLHVLGAEGPGGLPALWRSARFDEEPETIN